MSFQYLEIHKESIFKFVENIIVLNKNKECKLKGIIYLPTHNHYICIIFNPMEKYKEDSFKATNIYYHNRKANNGKICSIKVGDDLKLWEFLIY